MASRYARNRQVEETGAVPLLSCQSCTERKVRCDKQTPCSACQKIDGVCIPVQRRRLPRGRLYKALAVENQELRDKIANLETPVGPRDIGAGRGQAGSKSALIDSVEPSTSQAAYPSPHSYSSKQTPSSVTATGRAPHPQRYLADGFWEDLANKDPGLGEILSGQSSDEGSECHTETNGQTTHGWENSTSGCRTSSVPHPGGIVLGLSSGLSQNPQSYLNAALALRPASNLCQKMCQVYIERVDPIIRVFHRPLLVDLLMEDKGYLSYPPTHPTLDVLRASVFLLAIVSMSDNQCRSMFDTDKATLVETYRSACEIALDRVSLITTEDVTVLQSFVVYLIAIQAHDRSRTAWTLFSVAVRLATALRVNEDRKNTTEPFFEQQMRRRLWYTICLLDAHAALDRASEPLITAKTTQPAMPLNIDDSDFGPGLNGVVAERDGFTDMSLALRLYHTQATGKALAYSDNDSFQSTQHPPNAPSPYLRAVERFETLTQNLLKGCDPGSSNHAWMMHTSSMSVLVNIQLALRRPMHYKDREDVVVDADSTTVLRIAASVLEREMEMQTDPRGEPFRWFGVVHWHPLAVAISESHVCEDRSLLRELWPKIEGAFEHLAPTLSEYRQGTLWDPLRRLMVKTRGRVNRLLAEPESAPDNGQDPAELIHASEPSLWQDPGQSLADLGWGEWDEFMNEVNTSFSDDWGQL